MRFRLWYVLCVLAHRSGLACSLRLYESQISKLSRASGLDEGQPNNRELNEPSRWAVRALRQSQFNWTRLEKISVCSAELKLYMELAAWSTGIVSGGCGKRGDPSCRGEGAVACSLFVWIRLLVLRGGWFRCFADNRQP